MQDVESLFQMYKDDVYRLALSYTRSTQDAEDVCQTVFLKLMEQTHITPGKERSWLLQVAANTCRNLLRSSWWKKTAPMEESLSIPAPVRNDLLQTVMKLEPKYRVVIYLRYYEELSTKEMAQLLHISQSSVTTRLSRARRMLKASLEEEYV